METYQESRRKLICLHSLIERINWQFQLSEPIFPYTCDTMNANFAILLLHWYCKNTFLIQLKFLSEIILCITVKMRLPIIVLMHIFSVNHNDNPKCQLHTRKTLFISVIVKISNRSIVNRNCDKNRLTQADCENWFDQFVQYTFGCQTRRKNHANKIIPERINFADWKYCKWFYFSDIKIIKNTSKH